MQLPNPLSDCAQTRKVSCGVFLEVFLEKMVVSKAYLLVFVVVTKSPCQRRFWYTRIPNLTARIFGVRKFWYTRIPKKLLGLKTERVRQTEPETDRDRLVRIPYPGTPSLDT